MDTYLMFVTTMRVLELGCSIITSTSLLAIAYYTVGKTRRRSK